MPRFIDFMRALAKETQWKSLETPDATGAYHVALDGDIDLEFSELSSGMILLRSCVAELPDTPNGRSAFLTTIGRLMVGVRRYRATHITLLAEPGEREKCIAYKKIPLSVTNLYFFQEVESAINDIAWWKRYSVSEEECQPAVTEYSSVFSQFFSPIQP